MLGLKIHKQSIFVKMLCKQNTFFSLYEPNGEKIDYDSSARRSNHTSKMGILEEMVELILFHLEYNIKN